MGEKLHFSMKGVIYSLSVVTTPKTSFRDEDAMYQFDRERYEERIRWWTEARFGMFIHWGLYALAARGEWLRSTEEMSLEHYQKYFDQFNPDHFDPYAWVTAAKRAGMRYVVLTAKHHDGFCLFDSKLSEYTSMHTPFGRDIVREFLEAARAVDLKVGLYFSLIDWSHPDFPQYQDRQAPHRNDPAHSNEHRNWDRYLEFMHGQVRELCENYGTIDLFWFDFSYDDLRGEAWGATKLMDMVRSLQPEAIINNRLEVSGEGFGSLAACKPTPYHGDFITPEQIVPPQGLKDAEGRPLVWETCLTMNHNWGYHAHDTAFKSSTLLIHKLVECVSKGGNLILNIGPDARGCIPAPSLAILDDFAAWMDKNAESIYGCTSALGGAYDLAAPELGRLTRKGTTYYLHLFEPTLGVLPLWGISHDDIVSMKRLYDGSEVLLSTSWTHSDYNDIPFLNMGPSPELPCPVDTVIEVVLKDRSHQ